MYNENAWYALKAAGETTGGYKCYEVSKFTKDGEFQQTYTLQIGKQHITCDCPAGFADKYCRHKKTYHQFVAEGRLDKGWLYCFDTKTWKEPEVSDAEEAP